MLQYAHFQSLRRSPFWLLAIGLFAMAMQTLGGTGITARNAAGGGFYAEICTGKGVSKVSPAAQSANSSLPDSDRQDCCKLCVAGAPLLLADTLPAVPPAPTFSGILVAASLPYPSALARLSHPPRGPPAA